MSYILPTSHWATENFLKRPQLIWEASACLVLDLAVIEGRRVQIRITWGAKTLHMEVWIVLVFRLKVRDDGLPELLGAFQRTATRKAEGQNWASSRRKTKSINGRWQQVVEVNWKQIHFTHQREQIQRSLKRLRRVVEVVTLDFNTIRSAGNHSVTVSGESVGQRWNSL